LAESSVCNHCSVGRAPNCAHVEFAPSNAAAMMQASRMRAEKRLRGAATDTGALDEGRRGMRNRGMEE